MFNVQVPQFCPYPLVEMQNLDVDKQVQATIHKAVVTMKQFQSCDEVPAALFGKSYAELEEVAMNAMATVGIDGKKGSLNFNDFIQVLNNLKVRHTEPQAYQYFVLVRLLVPVEPSNSFHMTWSRTCAQMVAIWFSHTSSGALVFAGRFEPERQRRAIRAPIHPIYSIVIASTGISDAARCFPDV